MTRANIHDLPGYGLRLFGAVLPFPPAPVLWAMAVLDIVATIMIWRRPRLWWVLAVGLIVSAYLTVVGVFSIGPIYFLLFWLQFAGLVRTVKSLRRR